MLQFASVRKSSVVLFVVAGLLSGCGDDDDDDEYISSTTITLPTTATPAAVGPVEVDQGFTGSTVGVELGQVLLVRLPQNPDDRGQWTPVNVEEGVLHAEPPQSEGLSTVYPFRAVGPGMATLQFAYGPASEPPLAPGPEFILYVQVD
ncbi:protease inhibitor I42 family protein [Nocardia asteroides]|uniref:protease inhibitor I42 family protein n=1 Tax=Nocardia asteroides TaxID=1824 RepID=UPI003445F802